MLIMQNRSISSARQLRQSIASLVRDNVYINPNLTKAEASAAYELRCRHREAANRRSTAGARPAGHPAHQHSANAEGVVLVNLLGLVSDSSATVNLTTSTSTSKSTLSCQSSLHPTAAVFTPGI